MAQFMDRLKHGWNAFVNEPEQNNVSNYQSYGASYGSRPDRIRSTYSNEKSILNGMLNHIAIDVAANGINHVRLDDNQKYLDVIQSGLQNCLSVEANIDQSGRAIRQDMAMSLFEKGCIAIVPIDTTLNPEKTGGYDIQSMRVGEIIAWYPQHVRVRVYNEQLGRRQELTLSKKVVAIAENPLYSVMNEPNSTLQRLIRKLNLLDAVDEASSSGKLDIIIQLPYVVKSDARRHQAEQRRNDLEDQLKGSKYGIAYADGTEKITQLNRPAENNMLAQVQYLTDMLYSQLGITEAVMNGTADEKTMINYYNRTVEPVLGAISDAMNRTFLTKTARSQKQAIVYYRDPFKLVPVTSMADIADKFTRNEILSSNEVRSIIGYKPSDDPKADQLLNKNLPQDPATQAAIVTPENTAVTSNGVTVDPARPIQGADLVNSIFKDYTNGRT